MSISFSDTTNKDGIIQNIEDECGFNDGDISGDTTLLAKFTGDINIALDAIFAWIFNVGGIWQFDDYNHVDYPIITTDINSSQREYSFVTDGSGNIILDIYKVMVADPDGIFHEIKQVDQQSMNTPNENVDSFYDGVNTEGTPLRYDMTANGIFLDVIPNYSQTGGLKVFINREATYFTTSDTAKKAGFSGLFHYLLVLLPSFKYARIHSLPQRERLKEDMLEMRKELEDSYGNRSRDITKRLVPVRESNK